MLSKTVFREHRHSVILGALVLVMVLLSLALRGTVRPETETQVNGLQHIESVETITGKTIFWSGNFSDLTRWKIQYQPNGTQASLEAQNNLLNLAVAFPQKSVLQAVDIETAVNISLDKDPVSVANVTVSWGVAYGIKFFGEYPNGTGFQAWNENSLLQHRPGRGTLENVVANLRTEVYLATGNLPSSGSRITNILFYIEANPQTSGRFRMVISGLSVFSYQRSVVRSVDATGMFSGLIIRLNHLPTNQRIFEVLIGFDIAGTSNLRYVPYFIEDLRVEAKGLTYVPKSIESFEEADFSVFGSSTGKLLVSPTFLNDTGHYVALSAIAGQMTFFRLDRLVLRLTSQTIAFEGNIGSFVAGFMELYLVLVFVVPATFVILLEKVLQWKKEH